MRLTYQTLRSLLAILYLTTGLAKLLDNRGFAAVLATYQWNLPEWTLLPLGVAAGLAEWHIGWNLARGHRLAINLSLTLVFHTGYALTTGYALHRGLTLTNCGCFGVFWARPLVWYTPLEDVVLMVVSAVCLWLYGRMERGG